MGDRFTMYAANLAGVGPFLLKQLREWSVSTGIAEVLESVDGKIDADYIAVGQGAPAFSLSTTMVGSCLEKIGIDALQFLAASTYTSFDCYLQKMAAGGLRASGNVHTKMTAAKGLLVPRRLSVSQGGNAEFSLDAFVVSVLGSAALPVVVTANQPLPAGNPGTSELFTLGPVLLNAVQLPDVLGIDFDFGLGIEVHGGDGVPFPTWVSIGSRNPTITVRTRNTAQLTALTVAGAALSADTTVYLRARKEGGTLYTDEEEEHVSLVVTAGRAEVTRVQGGVPSEAQVRIRPISDGTNPIVQIGTGVAIVLP